MCDYARTGEVKRTEDVSFAVEAGMKQFLLKSFCMDRSGENDTSRHSCDAGMLAACAQLPVICNSSPSVNWPRFRPRALTKSRSVLPLLAKLCVECGKILTPMTGYVNAKNHLAGTLYLNSTRKPCHNHQTEVVRSLDILARVLAPHVSAVAE